MYIYHIFCTIRESLHIDFTFFLCYSNIAVDDGYGVSYVFLRRGVGLRSREICPKDTSARHQQNNICLGGHYAKRYGKMV